MWNDPLYRNGLGLAILLHLFLGGVLITDHTTEQTPALVKGPQQINIDMKQSVIHSEQVVSAVSVNEKELSQAVQALKLEKEKARQAEVAHQNAMRKKAEQARSQRIAEEQKLKKLRDEARKQSLAQKEKLRQEARRLEQLKQQKIAEEKRLAEVKKKQEQIRKEQELARKRQLEQAKLAEEKAAQLEKEKKAAAAAREAKMLSEAEKYKLLIVNAISRQWILPENVDKQLSSRFEIRLGPDGSVLDVRLIQSSGDAILDRSAQTAIYKASPLPVPTDTEMFEMFRNIRLTVRPENVRG